MAAEHGDAFDEARGSALRQTLFYQTGGYDDRAASTRWPTRIAELDAAYPTQGNHLFYLATPPNVFEPITTLLAEVGLATPAPAGRA
jgi:glucose-6-phosphate 1-dehydrogenase